jgi:hypothetical protein
MIICLISMSPDGHMGTKIYAACCLLGETWWATLVAAIVVSALDEPYNYL